jgi:chromosome segregation ATPase
MSAEHFEVEPITTPDYVIQLRNILDEKEERLEVVEKKWHNAKSVLGSINKEREDLTRLCDSITETLEALGFKP